MIAKNCLFPARPLLAVTGLVLLGACATPQSSTITTKPACDPQRMVDPVTDRLDPTCYDRGFSLARLVDDRVQGRLDPNDRRFIDTSFDDAFLDPPATLARHWSNPANTDYGSIDLKSRIVDPRSNEICGIVNHESQINRQRVVGTVTLCRAMVLDAVWRVDAQSFEPPPKPEPTSAKPPPRAPQTRQSGSGTGGSGSSGTGGGTSGGTGGTGGGSSGTGGGSTGSGGTTGGTSGGTAGRQPIIAPPCDGVPEQSGQVNVGDCLQDQSPHIPATPR